MQRQRQNRRTHFGWGCVFLMLGLGGAGLATNHAEPPSKRATVVGSGLGDRPARPSGELGRVIAVGEAIVRDTGQHALSRPYVGNQLSCSSCHLEAGTDPVAASFLGTATAYPAWSPREKRVITLEERIGHCFARSMNGRRPVPGSEVSVAIAAYITWLSSGEPIAPNAKGPLGPRAIAPLALPADQADAERGRLIYERQCADCHGDAGEGGAAGPPVWGDQSYNSGAGLAQVGKLGAYLKVAMPLGDPTLSEQDALDVAAFVNGHDRPRYDPAAALPFTPAPER